MTAQCSTNKGLYGHNCGGVVFKSIRRHWHLLDRVCPYLIEVVALRKFRVCAKSLTNHMSQENLALFQGGPPLLCVFSRTQSTKLNIARCAGRRHSLHCVGCSDSLTLLISGNVKAFPTNLFPAAGDRG